MPIIEEVNDDANGDRQSASHAGAGDHAETASSGSAFSRLMVSVTKLFQYDIGKLELVTADLGARAPDTESPGATFSETFQSLVVFWDSVDLAY